LRVEASGFGVAADLDGFTVADDANDVTIALPGDPLIT
jgi:hypothetical protein